MKQNITIAVDKSLLRRARSIAAQRGSSISGLLAQELQKISEREAEWEQAKQRALARLRAPFHLGGAAPAPRESLHDRPGLR